MSNVYSTPLSSYPLAFSAASVDIHAVPVETENIVLVSIADDDVAVSGAAAHVKTERADPVSVSTDDRALPISPAIAQTRTATNNAAEAATEKKLWPNQPYARAMRPTPTPDEGRRRLSKPIGAA